jgi:hypothetical protein
MGGYQTVEGAFTEERSGIVNYSTDFQSSGITGVNFNLSNAPNYPTAYEFRAASITLIKYILY